MIKPTPALVRPAEQNDFAAWQSLWNGYNAFYGREGETALPSEITRLRGARRDTRWKPRLKRKSKNFRLLATTAGRPHGDRRCAQP